MLSTSSYIAIVLTCGAWSIASSPRLRNLQSHHDHVPASRIHYIPNNTDPSPVEQVAGAATPDPTGSSSPSTTVHINSDRDFALLLPKNPGGIISNAEREAISFCYGSNGCARIMPDGLILRAHVSNGSYEGLRWIQVTGCIDPSKYQLSKGDAGGQFDVRYPQGAQCSFGGYGASFIEQIEPAASRFCMRCCSTPGDQTNCNSHHDRDGCLVAVPGVYSFADGVACDS